MQTESNSPPTGKTDLPNNDLNGVHVALGILIWHSRHVLGLGGASKPAQMEDQLGIQIGSQMGGEVGGQMEGEMRVQIEIELECQVGGKWIKREGNGRLNWGQMGGQSVSHNSNFKVGTLEISRLKQEAKLGTS